MAERSLVGGLALPDGEDAEAESLEGFDLAIVSPSIVAKLLQPPGAITLRDSRSWTAWMLMPEAAVNEHRPLPRAISDVGRAGQIAIGETKPVAEGREHLADDALGCGVGAALVEHAPPGRGVGGGRRPPHHGTPQVWSEPLARRATKSRKPGGKRSLAWRARE